MTIQIPDFSLVLLIGVSGSGKSTFARTHFRPTEVLSSDAFRGWVSDDENSLEATSDAFDALHYLAAIRLRRRKLVVIDATNVQPDSRKPLLKLAADHDALAVAIVLDVPEGVCHERNQSRPDRNFGPHVVRNQSRQLRQSLRSLRREGFRYVYHLSRAEDIDSAQIERTRLWTDRSHEHGPFDIIGDVHGCYDELVELLERLGYESPSDQLSSDQVISVAARSPVTDHSITGYSVFRHPAGRKPIFLGDLVDRGQKSVEAAGLVMRMVEEGLALCVPGNHDVKLMRYLQGKNVQLTHGLPETVAQIEALPEEARELFKTGFKRFADSLVSHYLLDGGNLVVAHAGMKEAYQARASGRVRDFAIWGDTTGETDEFGLPIRYPWAEEYRGAAMVVYGHTPVPEAEWLNRTINIDTGCVFGGKLTALRYPEREIVQVPARRVYAEPARPFLQNPVISNQVISDQSGARTTDHLITDHSMTDNLITDHLTTTDHSITDRPTLQWQSDELLNAEDVLGKRIIRTRLGGSITVRAENAAAALEVMSRFAVGPRWIIYLPPTMSPSETTSEPGFLEYPREAFAYYRAEGVPAVVCQTKHMGSRAVVVVCRDEAAAFRRFGCRNALGECYTRTGRRFFDEELVHAAFLQEAADAMQRAGLWEELATDWVCLDAELMPWNAKAQGLLREQYAPVGAAAGMALAAALEAATTAVDRGLPLEPLAESLARRRDDAARFVTAYGHYCWEVQGLQDLKIAPFHLLATEGKTYFDRDHEWHVATLARLADSSDLFMRTESRTVDLLDDESQDAANGWWREYTESGGEGMVVKPKEFVARGRKGLVQPAVKVRGREYLRIIYGPEYTEPQNLARLRNRSVSAKRSLAAREFALGVEGLERFVRYEPLRSVHECAFAVLALESEPVDPRL